LQNVRPLLKKIAPARIALWDTYGGSMSSGWVRFIMEQYHFPIEVVYPKDIDTGGLRAKYDVIVFVEGAIPAPPSALGGGRGFGGGNFGGGNNDNVPEEFRSNVGKDHCGEIDPATKKIHGRRR
jgi:hypothetical protein